MSQPSVGRAAAGAPVLSVADDQRVRPTIRWALEDKKLAAEAAARQVLAVAGRASPVLIPLGDGLPNADGEVRQR